MNIELADKIHEWGQNVSVYKYYYFRASIIIVRGEKVKGSHHEKKLKKLRNSLTERGGGE